MIYNFQDIISKIFNIYNKDIIRILKTFFLNIYKFYYILKKF